MCRGTSQLILIKPNMDVKEYMAKVDKRLEDIRSTTTDKNNLHSCQIAELYQEVEDLRKEAYEGLEFVNNKMVVVKRICYVVIFVVILLIIL